MTRVVELPLLGALERLLGMGPADDSRPAADNEMQGTPDGAPIRLPSGIVLQKRRVGSARVAASELMAVIRGIQALPPRDRAAIARAGVPVALLPSTVLENNLLGATQIIQPDGSSAWHPTSVRVAVRRTDPREVSASETIQHELGHVLAVLRHQDRSEAAAEAYAHSH